MKIAFSGAQSTGKSTLLQELKKKYDCLYIENITRDLAKQGYKINEMGNDETQLKIMEMHEKYSKIKNHRLIFYDRCALDGIVYTHYLYEKNKILDETFNRCLKIFETTINKYDKIYYTCPEFDIVDDNQRSLNKEFRNRIVKLFEYYIQKYNIKIYRLKGSVEERLKKINFEYIDEISENNKEILYDYVNKNVENDILKTFNTLWDKRNYWKYKPLVYKRNNDILGFIAYTMNEKYLGKLKVYYLHVKKEERKKGIAKKLLNEVYKISIKNKLDLLYVTEENTDGIKLFKNYKNITLKKRKNEFNTTDTIFEIPYDVLKHLVIL